MKKRYSYLLIISVISILFCLISAPIVCMPLDYDEYWGTYEVDALRPVLYSFISSIASAVSACLYVRKITAAHSCPVNIVMVGVGIGIFGLFYGFYSAYNDASKILMDNIKWGLGSAVDNLPEWAERFSGTAKIYAVISIFCVVIAVIGFYKSYKASRN